jgi:uncharacterized protein (DUF934 family)
MRQIIHRREVQADDAFYAGEEPVAGARQVVTLAELLAGSGAGAVLIEPADDITKLVPHLSQLQLIVVAFPKIGEGRGYSQGRLLRQRFGYRGGLRARGALKRDQLVFLARCGFDSFELDPAEDLQAALSAFDTFSAAYQNGDAGIVQVKRRN